MFLDGAEALGPRIPRPFPAIAVLCRAAGVDPVSEPIPVRRAADYHKGGITMDPRGRTLLPGSSAAGEVASTGVHGANRLASNSLLQAAVFGPGRRGHPAAGQPCHPPLSGNQIITLQPDAASPPAIPAVEAELRRRMDDGVGVVRDHNGLQATLGWLRSLRDTTGEDGPLRHKAEVALTIAAAALARTESRGANTRRDFPAADPGWAPTKPSSRASYDLPQGCLQPDSREISPHERKRQTLCQLSLEPLVKAALMEDLPGRRLYNGRRHPSSAVGASDHRRPRNAGHRRTRVAGLTFRSLDPAVACEILAPDGSRVSPGQVVMQIEGRARALLSAERTGLNFLGRHSGAATATTALVQAVEGYDVWITCTFKTTPPACWEKRPCGPAATSTTASPGSSPPTSAGSPGAAHGLERKILLFESDSKALFEVG